MLCARGPVVAGHRRQGHGIAEDLLLVGCGHPTAKTSSTVAAVDGAEADATTVGERLDGQQAAPEFGVAIGYGEDQVYKVEAGKRIPRREHLDGADEVLGAGG